MLAACHWSRAAQRSAAAALSCPTCGEMPGDTGGPQAPTPFTLHKLGSWGWGSWEPLRSQLLRGGVRFTISRCSLVTRVQFQLQNLRFICVLFSSFHGNPHGSQSSAQEEWLAAPSSPASCQAFREERGGPETGPASGSAGRGRGPQGSRSAQGLRASLAWRGAIFPITGQQTEAQGRHLLQARRAGRTELWQTVQGAWLAARHVRAVATWPEPHGHGQGQLHAWPRGATHPVPLGSHAATCRRRAPRSLRGLTTVGSPGRSPGPLRLHSLSRNPAAPRGSSCLLIRVQGPGGHVATSWPRCSCRGCRCGALPPGGL